MSVESFFPLISFISVACWKTCNAGSTVYEGLTCLQFLCCPVQVSIQRALPRFEAHSCSSRAKFKDACGYTLPLHQYIFTIGVFAQTQNYTSASCFRGKSIKEATAGKTGTQHKRKIGCSDSPEEFIWEPQPGVPAAVWQICSRQYQGRSVVEFATYVYFYCDW